MSGQDRSAELSTWRSDCHNDHTTKSALVSEGRRNVYLLLGYFAMLIEE
jgi:hypothetical protein